MRELNLDHLSVNWTDEMKAKQSEVGKRVMACPIRRRQKSAWMRQTISKLDAAGKQWRQKGPKNRKPVTTPYGEFASALEAGKRIGPKLGLKPCTIQAYIIRTLAKYKNWRYL